MGTPYTSKQASATSLVIKLPPKSGVGSSAGSVALDGEQGTQQGAGFHSKGHIGFQHENAGSVPPTTLINLKSIAKEPKEGKFLVKRLVSNNGERMLTCLKDVCHKIEILAILPQIMTKLVEGNYELEETLGEETVDAVFKLLDIQKNWLDTNFGGPEKYGVSKDQYMADRMTKTYKEVLRLITFNEQANWWFQDNLTPEVTQAVKIFYCQIQILEGLMYARLLMSPEEEIRRIQSLKETWIKEQRLLRKLKELQDELDQLAEERAVILEKLNENVNALLSLVDGVDHATHQELNKISADAAKKELVTAKLFDQELQQLDGIFQKALKFATQMRAKFSDMEITWRKKRFKLQAELEALVERYDNEMNGRQDILDDLTNQEAENQAEIEKLQDKLKKVQLRHDKMLEEIRLKELAEKAKRKKKKKGKGKKGKKGKRRSKKKSKGKKKGKGKGKGKKGKGKGKGKKKKGKKAGLGESEEGETEDEEEGEDEDEEEEGEDEEIMVDKKKKKRKTRKSRTGSQVSDEEFEGEGGDKIIKVKKPKKPKSPKKAKSPKKKGKKEKEPGKILEESLEFMKQQERELMEEMDGEGYVDYDEFYGEYETEQALLARARAKTLDSKLKEKGVEEPKPSKKGKKGKKRSKSKKKKKGKKKILEPPAPPVIIENVSNEEYDGEGEWLNYDEEEE